MQKKSRAESTVGTPKFEIITLAVCLCLAGCGSSADDTGDTTMGGASNVAGSMATAGSPPVGTAGSNAVGGSPAGGSSAGGEPGTSGAAGSSVAGAPAGGAGAGGAGAGAGAGGGAGAGMGGSAGKGGSGGGAAGSGGATSLPKFVGNITTGNSIDTGGMTFSKYWDQISPENAGKWGSVQSSATSAFNWSSLDSIYAYAETNHIIFKQHNFVWGSQQPSGTPTEAQVENWIKSFCMRYPNTKLIDVVNEPPPHTTPNYTANLGAGETGTYGWITKAFKLARQYCGNAVLILNDYNNIENNDENHFIDIVTQIKAAGAPIDAVGCQAHGLSGMSATTLQTNLDTMATKTGLPIYITEYDINNASDAGQLSSFQTQIPIFRKTAAVHGITIWGWIAGRTWETNSGLVKGTTPRSAMTWLMTELGRPIPPN